ncbi:MAG TPA: hypothetical protein VFU19_17905 [Iamia sp.]|nr:hypothetical protein [Iamia sp.]
MTAAVLELVARASMLGHQGDRAAARALLAEAWAATADGPAVLRCAVAHARADVEDDPGDERAWDERALAEADVAAAEPPVAGLPPITALRPSLHLNLADVHRRLGDPVAARAHVAHGRAALAALPPDAPQPHVAAALDRIELPPPAVTPPGERYGDPR